VVAVSRATVRQDAAGRPIGRIGNDPSLITGVPIRECGEPLVLVGPEPGIFLAPAYYERRIPAAPDRIRVRQAVLDGLRRAAAALPPGTGLLLLDGLRTLQTQAAIVEDFRVSLPEEGREEMVARYLAPPPPSEQRFRADPPPHTTGGAIDLTLCDAAGRPLDLGAEFDEFEEIAWLAHFECTGQPAGTAAYRDRRRILYWAMTGAGFAPYPWEYWHYELGTTVAAVFHGLPYARYGAAVPWLNDSFTGPR
jgi:zinc D-Ala-D-Ala dipeptidase